MYGILRHATSEPVRSDAVIEKWSVKYKLIGILLVTTFIAVSVALVAFSILEIRAYQRSLFQETSSLGKVIAFGSRAALAFNDQEAAKRALESLSAKPNIVGAAIYTLDEELFVSYHRNQEAHFNVPKRFSDLAAFDRSKDRFGLTLPIVLHQDTLGHLYLQSDYEALYNQLWSLASIAFAVLCMTMLLAALITTSLHRIITRPLMTLVGAVQKVSESKDYTLRLPISSQDEFGLLYTNFNEMLSQIKERDEELVTARDKAESADRAKSLFLANMSHEIRTPMNGIMGMTELVLNSDICNEHRECLEIVLNCSDSLLAIINDILDFAKIESGKFEIAPGTFELRRYINQLMQPLTGRAARKDIDVVTTIEDNVPDSLIADYRRVNQIITNLVTNAIKFSPANSKIKVHVRADQLLEDEAMLHISVQDNGIGIPQDKQEAIFEAFTQADSSITRKFGGTGLGLSICKELAESMGGDIWLESEEGIGSTFYFTVQTILAPDVITHDSKGIYDEELLNSLKELGPLQVLVVDDNVVSQKLLKSYLTKVGFNVHVMNNGNEALEFLDHNSIDFICMDCQMPILDGFKATKIIRKREKNTMTRIPIIALTAFAMQGDKERCLAAGMDAYIPKPIKIKVLYQCILQLISKAVKTNGHSLIIDEQKRKA